jgi:hypothetical protein
MPKNGGFPEVNTIVIFKKATCCCHGNEGYEGTRGSWWLYEEGDEEIVLGKGGDVGRRGGSCQMVAV